MTSKRNKYKPEFQNYFPQSTTQTTPPRDDIFSPFSPLTADFLNYDRTELLPSNQLWWFAYDVNMNSVTLNRRIGTIPYESKPAILKNYRLNFNVMGFPYFQPGYANVEKHDGSEVHGVLHRINKSDFIKLCQGDGSGYEAKEVAVDTYDGKKISATVLVGSKTCVSDEEVLPSKKYLHEMLLGAKLHQLNTNYFQELRSRKTFNERMVFGKIITMLLVLPVVILMMLVIYIGDKTGLVFLSKFGHAVVFYQRMFVWFLHDKVFSKIFGSGGKIKV